LRRHGIAPVVALPGVGANLHDHPTIALMYAGTPKLERRMREFAATRWMPEEQTIAKARSRACRTAFDLHVFPIGGPTAAGDGWRWWFPIAAMAPQSRGRLALTSTDPTAGPRIDHASLTDSTGADLEVLLDGIALVRRLARQRPLAALLGGELWPASDAADRSSLRAQVRGLHGHYCHPGGTCRMGPDGDALAVTDARGRVRGLDNAWIADASLMPTIPRANTNMPVLVVAQRITGWLP
jgi:choline dehydrogenase